MIKGIRTLLLTGLILASLLLPKMGAAIVDLNPRVFTAVVCTGDRMVVMRIGPDGTPVELSEVDERPCISITPATPAALAAEHVETLALDFAPRFVEKRAHPGVAPELHPQSPQGPPVPV